MIKPGYKSSEFWFTLVSFIFSGLYLVGIIGDVSQKDELISNVSHAVESSILIGGQLLILYKYIKGRDDLKKLWWSTASPKERAAANKKKKGSSNESTRTHRPSKTSSRIK